MIPDKDTELLQEAYISATQKTVNVPPRVPYRQVGDTHNVNTLSDKMQGVKPDEVSPEENSTDISNTYDEVVKRLVTPEEDIQGNETSMQTNHDQSVTPSIIPVVTLSTKENCEEIEMTKTNLYSIFMAAKKLHDFLENGHKPETWAIHKIAICADGISNVLKVSEYDYDKQSCL
jgi:hypothetical protein